MTNKFLLSIQNPGQGFPKKKESPAVDISSRVYNLNNCYNALLHELMQRPLWNVQSFRKTCGGEVLGIWMPLEQPYYTTWIGDKRSIPVSQQYMNEGSTVNSTFHDRKLKNLFVIQSYYADDYNIASPSTDLKLVRTHYLSLRLRLLIQARILVTLASRWWWGKLNSLRAKFFRGKINIYLHFMSLLHIDMTQVLKILPQVRPGPTYSTKSISWLLMSWRRKEPGHQQPWYWPN